MSKEDDFESVDAYIAGLEDAAFKPVLDRIESQQRSGRVVRLPGVLGGDDDTGFDEPDAS